MFSRRSLSRVFWALLLLQLWSPRAAAADLDRARRLQQQGALKEARELYLAALPELRAASDPRFLGDTLRSLTQIAIATGDYAAAIGHAREAAAVFRRLHDASGEGRALNGVGLGELYRGAYPVARDSFRAALDLLRAAGDAQTEISCLNNLANTFYFEGRYLEALRYYQAALARVEETRDQPWNTRSREVTVTNLASLYQRLGHSERALDLYLDTGPAGSAALSRRERSQRLSNLGVLYSRLGDPYKALTTYEAALDLLASERDSDAELGIRKNIGILHAGTLADYPAAVRDFRNVLSLATRTTNRREEMVARLYLGDTLLRQGHAAGAGRELERALTAARALGAAQEQWVALYSLGRLALAAGEAARARELFEQSVAVIESLRSALSLVSLRSEFLADKRQVYDARISLALDSGEPLPRIFEWIERARSRSFQDRAQLPRAGLAAIQSRLDPSSVLLSIWTGSGRLAVLWATHTESGLRRVPFTSHESGRLQLLLETVSRRSGEEWRVPAEVLGSYLLTGIEPLRHASRLLILPDESFAAVPFEVLLFESASLLERFDVSYLPAAGLLLRDVPSPRRWAPPWTRQLVAFGDPVAPAASLLPGDEEWSLLPRSSLEVRAIANLLTGRSSVYTGSGARKSQILSGALRGAPLVHFATHAVADLEDPERSRMLLAGPEYLYLNEIYDLDLSGVDLVTLSACETERGKVVHGEGVEAFSRAFLAAGARSTVTSLWRISDEPAAEFMKQFYYLLSRGVPKSEALRQAKLRLYRSRGPLSHPRHWAPFILNGEGRRPAPSALSWGAVLLAPAALAAVAAVRTVFRFSGPRA